MSDASHHPSPSKAAQFLRFLPWIAIAYLLTYLVLNHSPLLSDEGNQLRMVQKTYETWLSGDWRLFFHDLYYHRTWRPVITTAIASLLLTMFHGQFALTTKVYSAIAGLLIIFAVHWYFRRLGGFRRYVFSMLVLMAPWMLMAETRFASESTAMIGLIAGLGFYQNIHENLKLGAKFWPILGLSLAASLMMLSRPIEAVLIFAPLLLYTGFKFQLNRNSQIWFLIVIAWITLPLFSYAIFQTAIRQWPLAMEWSPFFLALLVSTSALILIRQRKQWEALALFGPISWLCFLWYGPFFYWTAKWVYDCTLSDLAKQIGYRYDQGPGLFLMSFPNEFLGLLPAISFLVCCLVVVVFARPKLSQSTKVVPLSLLMPLLAATFSYNGDLRYHIFMATGLMLVFGRLNYSITRPWIKNLLWLCGLLILANFLIVDLWCLNVVHSIPTYMKPSFFILPHQVNDNEKYADDAATSIFSHMRSSDLMSQHSSCILRSFSRTELDTLFDGNSLTVKSHQAGYKMNFLWPNPLEVKDTQGRIETLLKPLCCYVILFPVLENYEPDYFLMADVAQQFTQWQKQNQMQEHGFSFVEKFEIKGPQNSGQLMLWRTSNQQCLEGKDL